MICRSLSARQQREAGKAVLGIISGTIAMILAGCTTIGAFADPAYPSMILYYGPADQATLTKIASVHPTMAILDINSDGITTAGINQLHSAGTKVIGYMSVGYEGVPISTAISEANKIAGIADGVFVDNSNPSSDSYQSQLYSDLKGQGKTVICNPGMVYVDRSLMSVCDILSFEHEWSQAGQIPWLKQYPPDRYMGLSSDAGSGVGDPNQNLALAHSIGIAYQYSTPAFTVLPDWVGIYSSGATGSVSVPVPAAANTGTPVAASASTAVTPTPSPTSTATGQASTGSTVSVSTVNTAGAEVTGFYIALGQNGQQIQSAYSPAQFTVNSSQTYQVTAEDYGGYVFDHWSDGTTSRVHLVTAGPGASTLTAVYRGS